MTRTLVRIAAALTATLLAGGLLSQPAGADDSALPVVGDDLVRLYPGQQAVLNVLANDSSPSGDDLALCRFPWADPWDDDAPVIVMDLSVEYDGEPGEVVVAVHPRATGTYVFDYYVCDHAHLVPARLTVEIHAVEPVDVTISPDHVGRLLVTNHNDEPVRFVFGHRQAYEADGQVQVAAGATVTVRVQRHRIYWVAAIGEDGAGAAYGPGIADYGLVRGIKIAGPPLPPPHWRSRDDVPALLARWS